MIDKILSNFEKISSIPRCSGNREPITRWLLKWAKHRSLETMHDKAGNVLIRASGTPGYSPIVVLQGHVDMVCVKTLDSSHDFTRDPISPVREGDWLRASGTSLGADNGMAVALCLTLLESDQIGHPPLEVLLTVDEETGLIGANELAPDWLKGRILLNMDSEEEGAFTVGCAGGRSSVLELPVEREDPQSGLLRRTIRVEGLQGGHSGVDIHRGRANANKVLARCLSLLSGTCEFSLMSLTGGSIHNAIPREAEAVIAFPANENVKIANTVKTIGEQVTQEYYPVEENLRLAVNETHSSNSRALSGESFRQVLSLLLALPDGVIKMSSTMEGLVETSCNLATAELKEKSLEILISQRSSLASGLQYVTRQIESVGRLAGAEFRRNTEYPPWTPDPDSRLLRRCREIYRKTLGGEARIRVIHGGLECAVFGVTYPGMDMISIGPTAANAHSPDERVNIPSIAKIWEFLAALMDSFQTD